MSLAPELNANPSAVVTGTQTFSAEEDIHFGRAVSLTPKGTAKLFYPAYASLLLDQIQGTAEITCVATDKRTDAVYVAGTFRTSLTLGDITLETSNNRDIFVGKISTLGVWEWASSLKFTQDVSASHLVLSEVSPGVNHLYIAGFTGVEPFSDQSFYDLYLNQAQNFPEFATTPIVADPLQYAFIALVSEETKSLQWTASISSNDGKVEVPGPGGQGLLFQTIADMILNEQGDLLVTGRMVNQMIFRDPLTLNLLSSENSISLQDSVPATVPSVQRAWVAKLDLKQQHWSWANFVQSQGSDLAATGSAILGDGQGGIFVLLGVPDIQLLGSQNGRNYAGTALTYFASEQDLLQGQEIFLDRIYAHAPLFGPNFTSSSFNGKPYSEYLVIDDRTGNQLSKPRGYVKGKSLAFRRILTGQGNTSTLESRVVVAGDMVGVVDFPGVGPLSATVTQAFYAEHRVELVTDRLFQPWTSAKIVPTLHVEKDKNTVGSVAAKVLATSEAIFMLCTYFVPEERFKVPLVPISQPSEPKPLEPKPLPIVLQQPSNPKKMKRVFSSSISAKRPISTTSVDPQNALGNANQYYFATHYHGVSAIVQIFNNGTFRGLNSRQVSLSDMRAFDMDYLLDGSIVFSGADILNSSEHPFLIGEPPIPLNQFLPGGVQVPPGIPFVVSNVQLPSGIPFTVSQAPNTFVTKWTTKGDILLGIAQTDSLKGTPVIVALDGTSPAHSNLSTGQLYYAGAAGTLSTEGKVLAGLALSPSLLHLRRE